MQVEKTLEQYALEELRTKRDSLLNECDWVVVKYIEAGLQVPHEWVTYRQALRDLTNVEIKLHPKYKNLDWSQIQMPQKPE